MANPANGPRRMKVAAVLELVLAAGFLAFWAAFFSLDMVDIADPRLREIYLAFESSFPPADFLLAVALAGGGIGLLRRKRYGGLLTLAGGGALVFLGLLDISFNTRQGIYGLGAAEAVLNGAINFICLSAGGLLIHTIWVISTGDGGLGRGRNVEPAGQER